MGRCFGGRWVSGFVGSWPVVDWSVVGGSVVGGFNKTHDKCGNDSRILFKDTGSLMNEIKTEISRTILATINNWLILVIIRLSQHTIMTQTN